MRARVGALLCLILAVAPWLPATGAAKPEPKPMCPASGISASPPLAMTTPNAFRDAQGIEIILAGIAPQSMSRDVLERALSLNGVTYAAVGADRYGRLPAQVFTIDRWLQEDWVRSGQAIVMPDAAAKPC